MMVQKWIKKYEPYNNIGPDYCEKWKIYGLELLHLLM